MQITCPKCGTSITLEQNVYDEIANKIRNEEFEKENPSDLMIERELRVLRMVQERIVGHKNDAVWNANVN